MSKLRIILLAVILAVTANFSSQAIELIFRGVPQGIQPSVAPSYSIVTFKNQYYFTSAFYSELTDHPYFYFSSVFYAGDSQTKPLEGDTTFLDLTSSAKTLATVTSISPSSATNTCALYLGYSTSTPVNFIFATISTAFTGSTVTYSYSSSSTWVAFTPTGSNLQLGTVGVVTIGIPNLPGATTQVLTTGQSALKYIRISFGGASTSKAMGLDLLQFQPTQVLDAGTAFQDLTALINTTGTPTTIGTSDATNTCFLYLGFGTNTSPVRILFNLTSTFQGSTVVYSYDSAKNWVNFTPTDTFNQWNTTGNFYITIPSSLPGLSVDTETTGQSALKYFRLTFTGASTSKSAMLNTASLQFDLTEQTTLSQYTTLSEAYIASTTGCYLAGLFISSVSVNTVGLYDLGQSTTGFTVSNQKYNIMVPAGAMGYIPFVNPIYFANGLGIKPTAKLDITPNYYK